VREVKGGDGDFVRLAVIWYGQGQGFLLWSALLDEGVSMGDAYLGLRQHIRQPAAH
jgi:hypothetical protein